MASAGNQSYQQLILCKLRANAARKALF